MLFTDPVRVVVPSSLAERLAQVCTAQMTGHEWSAANVAAAREVLGGPAAQALVTAVGARVARTGAARPGWAVLALPQRLDNEQLQTAAAGMLALLGRPFFSIDLGGRLWIGGDSSPERDAASFGGYGPQAVHIDAPNVCRVPDYTSVLVLRPDPTGGGSSLVADLPAAVARLSDADRAVLRREEFFEGRADALHGVGAPRLPFPVLDDTADGGSAWIRWAGKLLDDARNAAHLPVLHRVADAVQAETRAVRLGRGQLLIADQQRIAHGRIALGPPAADGARRCLLQAKVAYDPAAPAQTTTAGRATVETGVGDV